MEQTQKFNLCHGDGQCLLNFYGHYIFAVTQVGLPGGHVLQGVLLAISIVSHKS